jgi:GT2 family glycosyltransferase
MLTSASIVTYNTSYEDIKNLIDSLTSSVLNKLYIIDNSRINLLENRLMHSKIVYLHNPSNPGFGASHNIALLKSCVEEFDYHFVINPDIYMSPLVVSNMVYRMEIDKSIGMMMPRIVFPNGKIQYLPKLLPTPLTLLGRKLKWPKFFYDELVNKYELRFVDEKRTYSCPILSGCFTLFRLSAVKEIGYYDECFFMYFEDWDLSRRMHLKYKTIYCPDFCVIHEYYSGANKNLKLLFVFIKSATKYFTKWGWLFDNDRSKVNKVTLSQFNK